MNLNHLHYFRVLAKFEHYTNAAKYLSITQPSLSHAIASLEKDLGTALFEKHGRNIRLTRYGRFFLEYVENGLAELEIGEQKLRELTLQANDSLKLGLPFMLGSDFIPPLIHQFLKLKNPEQTTFSFHQKSNQDLIEGLKLEKYDLILCTALEHEVDIEFIPMMNQEFVAVVSLTHPLALKADIDLIELINEPLIYFNQSDEIRLLIESFFKENGIKLPLHCEVEEDSLILGFVSVNYGIAILPRTPTLKNFSVKVLPIRNLNLTRCIYLASLRQTTLSPLAEAFKNFMLNHRKL
ncbi:MAG: LysR family transcriptional regulator [Turicibacter sp.]|nr:LysR family transcriptional regulator [Turicibacter sp.]